MALSLPIKIDGQIWIDLSVVKTVTTDDSDDGFQIEERSGCTTVRNLLDPKLTFEFSKSDESHGGEMASIPYPYSRYGHWYSDMESRGLFVQKGDVDELKILGKTKRRAFCYFVEQAQVGHSSFWYSHWHPSLTQEEISPYAARIQ